MAPTPEAPKCPSCGQPMRLTETSSVLSRLGRLDPTISVRTVLLEFLCYGGSLTCRSSLALEQ